MTQLQDRRAKCAHVSGARGRRASWPGRRRCSSCTSGSARPGCGRRRPTGTVATRTPSAATRCRPTVAATMRPRPPGRSVRRGRSATGAGAARHPAAGVHRQHQRYPAQQRRQESARDAAGMIAAGVRRACVAQRLAQLRGRRPTSAPDGRRSRRRRGRHRTRRGRPRSAAGPARPPGPRCSPDPGRGASRPGAGARSPGCRMPAPTIAAHPRQRTPPQESTRACGMPPTVHQRPRRAESTASAATPAVEVRSTASPSRTGTAPAAANAASSSVGDAALRARPPATMSPAAGQVRGGQPGGRPPRAARTRPRRAASRGATCGGGHVRVAATAGSQARRACLAASRAVAAQRSPGLVAPLAPPLRHRAGRRPRHDLVDADLGHRLHGQLAPVALGDALHHDEARVGRRRVPPGR